MVVRLLHVIEVCSRHTKLAECILHLTETEAGTNLVSCYCIRMWVRAVTKYRLYHEVEVST